MDNKLKGWVVVNYLDTTSKIEYIVPGTFSSTRIKAIKNFISKSGKTWEYWKRNYNFSVTKATQTNELNIAISK